MKKLIAIAILALSLTSCGYVERMFATVVGGGQETCHKGVLYVQFTSGASVAYKPDGSLLTC